MAKRANPEKRLHIAAWRPGKCSTFPLVPSKGYVGMVFFLLFPASELSEFQPQPLWNTPTIIPTAQDQSLHTLKGVANV